AVRDAAFRRQRSKVVGEVGECPSRAREEAEHAAREHGRGAGDEALRDQLAACHGAMVPLRRVGMPRLALDLDDHAFLPPSWDGHHWTNIAALPSTAEQTAFASVCVRSSGLWFGGIGVLSSPSRPSWPSCSIRPSSVLMNPASGCVASSSPPNMRSSSGSIKKSTLSPANAVAG